MIFSKKKSVSKLRIFGSSAWLVLGAIILAFVSSSYFKIILQKAAVQKEISNLKREKEKLEANNRDLASLLDYFASESYKEREMRLKLGLQKPGERVIVISREDDKKSEEGLLSKEKAVSQLSNLKKWWDYFFGKIKKTK